MLLPKAVPTYEHGDAQRELAVQLSPCHVRQGGYWWMAHECEIDFGPGERYLPDMAGWDSRRVAQQPRGARVRVVPQWICEILSPSTAARDQGAKQAIYHAVQVEHYWLLDLAAQTLTVLAWTAGSYRTELVARPGQPVSAPPFLRVELDLSAFFT